MKEMSLQKAMDFWAYLKAQEKLKMQAYFNTPHGSSYRDEVRAEAETYQQIANAFARNFEQSISSPQDIPHGLTAQQAASFLDYLDKEMIKLNAALEKTQRNRREALAKAREIDYLDVKQIYKETENLEKDQIVVFYNSRKNFISMLKEG
jgi:hypothetical protein